MRDGGMITTSYPALKMPDTYVKQFVAASTSLKDTQLGVLSRKLPGYYCVCKSGGVTRLRYVLLAQKAISSLGEPQEEAVVVGNTTNKARAGTPFAPVI